MNQDRFEQRYGRDWARFEAWLAAGTGAADVPPLPAAEVPQLYRRLCHHLALARERCYGRALTERLHLLVLEGHQRLYSARAGAWGRAVAFIGGGFPRLVRQRWRLFLVANLLFYGPALGLFIGVMVAPNLALTVMGPEALADLESMYGPGAAALGRLRASDTDILMFGYYIQHNIGIAFQTFAGGILLGLGTLFYLLFNGVFLGAAFGHLTRVGYGEAFYSFVIGHSALELTAIVLAGMAGLNLGYAVLHPGRSTRPQALKEAAREGVLIVYGVTAMLLAAAFVEAFWSSSRALPVEIKLLAGVAGWLAVAGYFLFAGRARAA